MSTITSYRRPARVKSARVQSMTWSAPIEATISTFGVLHTPVTSAPNALALVLDAR